MIPAISCLGPMTPSFPQLPGSPWGHFDPNGWKGWPLRRTCTLQRTSWGSWLPPGTQPGCSRGSSSLRETRGVVLSCPLGSPFFPGQGPVPKASPGVCPQVGFLENFRKM